MILNFLNNIKNQCNKLYPNKNFIIDYNKKQHQFQNTECGVFSIIYQIRWLNLLKRNKNPKLINIINNNKLTDNNVNEIRNSLYRPNIKEL